MYDYAIITVSEDLSDYVQFALGDPYNVKTTDYSTIPLYVTGCPWAIPNGYNYSENLYSAEGHVSTDSNTNILHYDMDTTGGQSGSPVYTITRHTKGNVSVKYNTPQYKSIRLASVSLVLFSC